MKRADDFTCPAFREAAMTQSRRRRRLRNALILANLTMLAVPTFASAGDGGELAAGLALGCCAGMAAASAVHSAEHAQRHHRHRHRDRVDVHHHYVQVSSPAPQPELRRIDDAEARAELAEAELWAQQHCEPIVEQPAHVRVYVTFRGADGRATNVRFDPDLRGSDFSECMASSFLRTRVSAFDGDEAIVRKSLGG
jgi:hypothetical protein